MSRLPDAAPNHCYIDHGPQTRFNWVRSTTSSAMPNTLRRDDVPGQRQSRVPTPSNGPTPRPSRAPSIIVDEPGPRPPPRPKPKKQAPQKTIEDFWTSFTTKTPGKAFTLLPDNFYATRAAAKTPRGAIPGRNALASYEQARAACVAKVAKIVRECRRINQKYRDPHFDIEADFKRWLQEGGVPQDCLLGLHEPRTDLRPLSVKRVEGRILLFFLL